jgi:predicted RNA binding protein YcfA (HicA-like mRNA interferase family)
LISSRDIIKKLTADGWTHVATRGDHWQFRHDSRPGRVTVPHPVKDIGMPLIKSIERQSGTKLR